MPMKHPRICEIPEHQTKQICSIETEPSIDHCMYASSNPEYVFLSTIGVPHGCIAALLCLWRAELDLDWLNYGVDWTGLDWTEEVRAWNDVGGWFVYKQI